MAIIILLNIIFAAFVVVGILALLGWGIASDRAQRPVVSHVRRRRAARPRLARVMFISARQAS